jgi:glycosyltransferase involved in cell wall biosynthesis
MKISIITVVFNNQNRISISIDSVINQSDADIEYIVVDGGSSDNTPVIVNSYGDKISKFICEPDKGIYDAINKGIRVATGDVIGILHSDDIFGNGQIISQIIEVFKQTGVDGVYGDLIYVNKENPDKVIRYWKSCPFKKDLLKKGWMPPHPTLFLRRKIFDNYGLYDTGFKISSDYDFILRIMSRPELKFEYFPQIITRMRVGGMSNRNLKNIFLKSKEDLRAMRKNKTGGWVALLMKNFSKVGQFFN